MPFSIVARHLEQNRRKTTYIPDGYTWFGVARSTVFISNRSQAVRLPKAVAFPEGVHQVEIIRLGNSRLITPIGRRWDEFFVDGPRVSEDFMNERDQPPVQGREAL